MRNSFLSIYAWYIYNEWKESMNKSEYEILIPFILNNLIN